MKNPKGKKPTFQEFESALENGTDVDFLNFVAGTVGFIKTGKADDIEAKMEIFPLSMTAQIIMSNADRYAEFQGLQECETPEAQENKNNIVAFYKAKDCFKKDENGEVITPIEFDVDKIINWDLYILYCKTFHRETSFIDKEALALHFKTNHYN